MHNLSIEHVAAISRAEGYIHPHIIPNMTAHHRKTIENDLELLAWVKKFLLAAIYSPGLPIITSTPEETEAHGDTGKNNPTRP